MIDNEREPMHLDDLFESFTSDGDFVPAVMAEKIIAHLEENDPDRLAEYLHERRTALVTDDLRHWLQSRRRRARLSAKPRQFGWGERVEYRGPAIHLRGMKGTTAPPPDGFSTRWYALVLWDDGEVSTEMQRHLTVPRKAS